MRNRVTTSDRALTAVESIQEGLLTVDIHRVVLFMNPAAAGLTGWKQSEAIGQSVDSVLRIILAEPEETWNPIQASIEDDEVYSLLPHSILIRKDGSRVPIEDSISPVHDADGTVVGATIIFRDTSIANSMLLRAIHRANHDPLTGLPNRTLLEDRIAQALAHLRRHQHMVAVLFIDVDSFKQVNDLHGHLVGDGLLKYFAKRLLGSVRGSDTVCRLAGDEFVILLPEAATTQDVLAIADKILALTRMPFAVEEKVLHLSVSVGVAVREGAESKVEELLKDADSAMYRAKHLGGNRVELFEDEIVPKSRNASNLEHDICHGLSANEFLLYYQPQINLRTGKIVGAEALLRWNSPQKGLLLPSSFISIAEQSDLIVPLGQWVLREALMQQRKWREQGFPELLMSANVSAVELENSGYLEAADAILREANVDSSCVILELTESALFSNKEDQLSILLALGQRGLQLAIDDFGTGYSSLTYLRRFPINVIKIDRGFIADCTVSAQDASLVKAIVSMGKSLNKVVIAEGVETKAQFDFLTEVGCDQAQGFYFSPPLPVDAFAKLSRKVA